jgi:hypothetical protein
MTDMSCDPERLAADRSAVNKQLDMLDIPQFDKAFGAWRDNQIQVIGIQRVDTELNPRLVFVTYRVIIPSGDVRSYTVQYNAHSASSSGVVLIVKVNGKYAVVRQRRFVIEQYLTELMRSFPAIPQDQIGRDDQLQDAHSVTAFMRYLKEFNLLRVLADPSRADEIELRG